MEWWVDWLKSAPISIWWSPPLEIVKGNHCSRHQNRWVNSCFHFFVLSGEEQWSARLISRMIVYHCKQNVNHSIKKDGSEVVSRLLFISWSLRRHSWRGKADTILVVLVDPSSWLFDMIRAEEMLWIFAKKFVDIYRRMCNDELV